MSIRFASLNIPSATVVRAELGTHVADAETPDAAHRAAIRAAAPPTLRTQMVGGELNTYYGSEAAVVGNALRR